MRSDKNKRSAPDRSPTRPGVPTGPDAHAISEIVASISEIRNSIESLGNSLDRQVDKDDGFSENFTRVLNELADLFEAQHAHDAQRYKMVRSHFEQKEQEE